MKTSIYKVMFLALLVGIPVAAWRMAFVPRNARAAEMMEEIEAKRSKLQALNEATGAIGNLEKEIDRLNKAITFFQSKLPSEKEIDKVLQEVWQLAETNRLITKSIRTEKRKNKSPVLPAGLGYREQPITIQLEGDFLGFYSFLQALENRPRIMRIHKMEMKERNAGPHGHVTIEFVVAIFFESEETDESWAQKESH